MRLLVAAANAVFVVDPDREEPRPRLRGRAPSSLVVDHAGRVWCGTFGHGVFRSEDAGESWTEAGLAGRNVTALAGAAIYAGTEPSAVFRRDGGGWRELADLTTLRSAPTWSFPPRPWTHHVRAILVDPHDPDRIHVAIEAGAIVRSQDGGRTWEDRVPGSPIDSHSLAAHPAAPGRIYAAAGDGWFESHDAGESWLSPDEGLEDGYLWSVAVDAADPDTVVISGARGPAPAHTARRAESRVWRRSGGEWRRVESGLPEPRGITVATIVAEPGAPGVFWAASNRGLFRSDDRGDSWKRIEIAWPEAFGMARVDGVALLPGA